MNQRGGYLTCADFGIAIGTYAHGRANCITDVEGVRVGHCTVTTPTDVSVQTGVTVVLPHGGNIFEERVIAACHVINGFGKSIGLMQLDELGVLDAPIALTNTFSVPTVADGVLDYVLDISAETGDTGPSVNPVILECNDGYLNDLRGRHVTRSHVASAFSSASADRVRQGAIGAGRGMSAFELKGGIGSASRVVTADDLSMTVGVLALTNLGRRSNLVVGGKKVVTAEASNGTHSPPGSAIAIVATDAPLTDRQLQRLLRRVQNGIARTGATTMSGSGEIAVGFSTATKLRRPSTSQPTLVPFLDDEGPAFDDLFAVVADATEEAFLNSMLNADPLVGRAGRTRDSLRNVLAARD